MSNFVREGETLRAQLEASLRIARAQDEVTAAMERADIAYRARAYRVAYRHLKRAMAHLDTVITNEIRSDAQ